MSTVQMAICTVLLAGADDAVAILRDGLGLQKQYGEAVSPEMPYAPGEGGSKSERLVQVFACMRLDKFDLPHNGA